MIALIVNADDLGVNTARDQGIFEAFEHGLVTSASLLANGESFANAANQAKVLGLPLGVHLNLADGIALNGPIKGLTVAGGRFPGKACSRQYLLSEHFDPEAINKELQVQIERVFAYGLSPDHLDTHQHFQLFPHLLPVIIDLAMEFDIIRLRNPCPAEPLEMDPDGAFGQELKLYRTLCAKTHLGKADKANLLTTDGLWGMPLLNRLDTESLCRTLETVPVGVWELMTHPGHPFASESFSGPEREKELVALTSKAARKIIVERNIRLISFEDLPCRF